MDNRHNPNNSRDIDEVEESFQSLGIAGEGYRPNNYSNANPAMNRPSYRAPTALPTIKLNPNAQEFVPRQAMAPPSYVNTMLAGGQQMAHNRVHASSYLNGGNNVANNNRAPTDTGEADIEDYVALSYLREFINSIVARPNVYEKRIDEITRIVNSYLDEDECILELIVNQIVDQSIIDVDFRFNGVKLCHHFMEKLRPTRSNHTFKALIFKRCQRECSRAVTRTTTENTLNHMRGLALFIADLYSRCGETELAEHLPNLLLSLLSNPSSNSHLENIKVVCQVLKLCGQQLDKLAKANKDTFEKVLETLQSENGELSQSAKRMIDSVLTLAANGWVSPNSSAGNNAYVNPYLNLDTSGLPINPAPSMVGGPMSMPCNMTNNFQMYDFGDCGDEFDEDVCRSFEQFISSSNTNNHAANSDNAL